MAKFCYFINMVHHMILFWDYAKTRYQNLKIKDSYTDEFKDLIQNVVYDILF